MSRTLSPTNRRSGTLEYLISPILEPRPQSKRPIGPSIIVVKINNHTEVRYSSSFDYASLVNWYPVPLCWITLTLVIKEVHYLFV